MGDSWDWDFNNLMSTLDSLQVGAPLLFFHCLQTRQRVMSQGALQIVTSNAHSDARRTSGQTADCEGELLLLQCLHEQGNVNNRAHGAECQAPGSGGPSKSNGKGGNAAKIAINQEPALQRQGRGVQASGQAVGCSHNLQQQVVFS